MPSYELFYLTSAENSFGAQVSANDENINDMFLLTTKFRWKHKDGNQELIDSWE